MMNLQRVIIFVLDGIIGYCCNTSIATIYLNSTFAARNCIIAYGIIPRANSSVNIYNIKQWRGPATGRA